MAKKSYEDYLKQIKNEISSMTYTPVKDREYVHKISNIKREQTKAKQSQRGYFNKAKGSFWSNVGNTVADVAGNVWEGFFSASEGISDWAKYRSADVMDFFGADKKAKELREEAKRNDTADVANSWEHIMSGDLSGSKSDDEINYYDKVHENSYLGDKGRALTNSMASTLTNMGYGALSGGNYGGLVTTGLSSAGQSQTEAYSEGANDFQAGLYGTTSGLISAGSEGISAGLTKGIGKVGQQLGFTKGATSGLVSDLTKNIDNLLVKNATQYGLDALGEGFEEVVEGVGTAFAQKAIYKQDDDLKELLKNQQLGESFFNGMLASALISSPNFTSRTVNGRVYDSGLPQALDKVVNSEVDSRVKMLEKKGQKVDSKLQEQIREQVLNQYTTGKFVETGNKTLDDYFEKVQKQLNTDTLTTNNQETILPVNNSTQKEVINQNSTQTEQNNFNEINTNQNNIKVEQNENVNENNSFAKQVDEVLNGTYPKGDMLVVSENTPKILQDIGLKDFPITLTQRHLKTITNFSGNYQGANYHNLGVDVVKQLPNAIANPLNILKSDTRSDSIVVITELADNQDRPIIASIKIDGKGIINDIEIDSNVMTSAYGRNNYDKFMKDNIAKGNLLYDIDEGIKKRSDGKLQLRPITSSTNNDSINDKQSQTAPLLSNSMQQNETKLPSSRDTISNMNKDEDVLRINVNDIQNVATNKAPISNEVQSDNVAQILSESPENTEKNTFKKIVAKLRANVLDKGAVFEDLAKKTKNRELEAKWDSMLTSEAKGQYTIGHGYTDDNGNSLSKALIDIQSEVFDSNKTQEFSEYMYHLLNIDRMSLKNRYEDMENKPVFGSSVTAEMSQKAVNEFEKNNPEFIQWRNDIYNYLRAEKQTLVDNNLISQETADKWAEMYPHYVPIARENSNAAIKVPLDTGRTGVNSPLKAAKGGSQNILPLFDTLSNRTLQTQKAIDRNKFGLELLNSLETDESVSQTDVDDVIDSIDNQGELLQDKPTPAEKPTLTIFQNGEKKTFSITDDMYYALSPTKFTGTLKLPNKIMGFQRAILTEKNPIFMITNAIKDAQDVLINSQHPAKTYAKLPEAYAQIITNGTYNQLYDKHGGEDNTYFDRKVNKFAQEDTGLKKIAKMPFEAIAKVNNVIEKSTRLAEFIASIEEGRSVDVAMLDAARVTTNFKAGGDFTKMVNRNGGTFLNASVQGFNQQIRNFREANMQGLRGYISLASRYAFAGVGALLVNGLLWKDDKDYEELSDYVKNNYYVVAKKDDGTFIRIPKGRTLAVIQNAFQQVYDASTGNDDVDLKEFTDLVINNLAPNNPIENNVLSPVVQAATNQTWYGTDLVPTRLQNHEAKDQWDESTDEFSKWLGQILNVSPYKINYVLNQYSGGVGDVVLPMITKETTSGATSTKDYLLAPLTDKFTTDSTFNNKYSSGIYDLSEELTLNANKTTATPEDRLKNKYINSVISDMSDLYKQKREIQMSDLPKNQKYKQVKEIQKQIDEVAKKGMTSYENTNVYSNYAKVGDKEYYLDLDDGWKSITEKENEKIKDLNMSDETKNTYFKEKQEMSDIKNDKSKDSTTKRTEISKIVNNSKLNDKELAVLYGHFYSDEDKLNSVIDMNIPIKEYIKLDCANISGQYDAKTGKTISGSKKNATIQYINGLNLSVPQKAILIKMQYSTFDSYDKQITSYVNSLNMSANDKKVMLTRIGFDNYRKDVFNYVNSKYKTASEKEEVLKDLGYTVRNGRVYW